MSIGSAKQIVPPHYQRAQTLHRKLKRHAAAFDANLLTAREQWNVNIKTPMTCVVLRQDYQSLPAGLTLSLPHDIARHLVYRRVANVYEHDVQVDAVLDGELEDVTFPPDELETAGVVPGREQVVPCPVPLT